jgi:hypothetical protein
MGRLFIFCIIKILPLCNMKGEAAMGEVIVSVAIGGSLVLAGILMNLKLRREEKNIKNK